MKVEFILEIKEYMRRNPDSWATKIASIRIDASRDTIDKVIKALETVPDAEIK